MVDCIQHSSLPHSHPCHNHLLKCLTHYVFIVLNLCTVVSGLLTLWMLLSVYLVCHFAATDSTFPSPLDIFFWEAWFQFLFSVPGHMNILHFIFLPFSEIFKRPLRRRKMHSNTKSHQKPVMSDSDHALVRAVSNWWDQPLSKNMWHGLVSQHATCYIEAYITYTCI